MNKWVFMAALFLFMQKLSAADLEVSVSPEYNRAFLFCWDVSAVGSMTFNNRYTIKSGLALGTVGKSFDIKMFTGSEVSPFTAVPVSFELDYQYNGLPEFENHTHSILLLAAYKTKWAGVSLGQSFRFTSFFGEAAVFEPNFACSIYVFFINNELLRLGLRTANYDNFTSGNIGAYFLSLDSMVRLNKKVSLVNEIELHQSGSIALSSNFYSIVYRGGALFSW